MINGSPAKGNAPLSSASRTPSRTVISISTGRATCRTGPTAAGTSRHRSGAPGVARYAGTLASPVLANPSLATNCAAA